MAAKHFAIYHEHLCRLRHLLMMIGVATVLFPLAATAQPRLNGKIAFTSDRDGNREIYVMNADGTNQVRLTSNLVVDDHPTWSPDSKKIAFLSQNASGVFAIFVMNSDGTGKTEITPITVPNYRNKIMSWSPDGRHLAISQVDGIDIVDADGNNRRFLTPGVDPAWSPDGSKILFAMPRISGVSGTLHTIRPDGTESRLFLANTPYGSVTGYPDWSPDGSRIALIGGDTANQDMFMLSSDGTGPFYVVNECGGLSPQGCGWINSLAWSPDGSKIVYGAYGNLYVVDQYGNDRAALAFTGGDSNPSWQPLVRTPTLADFDGDGRSDISVFRPSVSTWYLDRSTTGFAAARFGTSTDRITPADYDGDGKTDISVFRDGTWFWLNSSDGVMRQAGWGIADDIPQPADYSGDGRAELAVFRPSIRNWFIYDVATGISSRALFGVRTDLLVPADYDGDGRTELAVYRRGIWFIGLSGGGYPGIPWGISTDRPVVGDYDGDGKADQAVYRDGTWYLRQSSEGMAAFQFGIATDVPVPADYDGDGRTDLAVYRDGIWYISQSSGGFAAVQFGLPTDRPVPAAFLPQSPN